MSDNHHVDVAIGLHPLQVTKPMAATELRSCLRRGFDQLLGPAFAKALQYNNVSDGKPPLRDQSLVIDGLPYFTGDWADANQTKYQTRFKNRLTLTRQSVSLGMVAVQLELSRRLRIILAAPEHASVADAFGKTLVLCAQDARGYSSAFL
eukprot:SAG31_NODE_179_length_21090_cov_11.862871_18_plen_150_part_00